VRVRQVIGNFLSNAIKFTERGSVTAALELRKHDPADGALGSDMLSLRITDTGIGVSEQAQARLFQPFSQAEADTTRRFGGTGLGLAISRRIARLMGGDVEMESVPGVGTTMRLAVRLHRAPAEELPENAAPGRSAPGFSPRRLPTLDEAERERSLVLLVDDHATNRQVIQRQLALAGYASETADDGVEGAGTLAQWALRCCSATCTCRAWTVTSWRAIREERPTRTARTPIVALTASALKGEPSCPAAGMDDHGQAGRNRHPRHACLQRWLPHLPRSA
jgi:CheY-like chemotaxis protein